MNKEQVQGHPGFREDMAYDYRLPVGGSKRSYRCLVDSVRRYLVRVQQDQANNLEQLRQRLDEGRREIEAARAREEQANQDRRQALDAALRVAARGGGPGDGIVDGRGVGQPPKFSGKEETEFQEWSHKMSCFASAKFGAAFQPAMRWAATQRKSVTADGADDTVSYVDEWGEEIEQLEDKKRRGVSSPCQRRKNRF